MQDEVSQQTVALMIQGGKVGLSGTRNTIFPRLICKNDCDDRGSCIMTEA